ncbi:hypothetical protein VNO77_16650 [Canavalia gladiata]|uniref:Uncharacterized protein n=1 Tax=Canavalia gladiata TaxID=3824 RepID=A0AAN9LL57_CANGL
MGTSSPQCPSHNLLQIRMRETEREDSLHHILGFCSHTQQSPEREREREREKKTLTCIALHCSILCFFPTNPSCFVADPTRPIKLAGNFGQKGL